MAASASEPVLQPVNLSSGAEADLTAIKIGASTGGLEAINEFLENLPEQTGMALVLVQDPDPKHESPFDAVACSGQRPNCRSKGQRLRPH
jgi:chemotaxis response regulator CheB